MGRMFVGLGALLAITAVMSFFMIKADRDRVDEANARLNAQQPQVLNVGATVAVEPLELMLKSAVLDKKTENSAVLTLELGISNKSDELISLEAADFVLYDGDKAILYSLAQSNSSEVSEKEEISWLLDYEVSLAEQFKLQIVSDKLNEGKGATFLVKPTQ